ncbi:MAG TPA: TetR/AcrR family transcriptional regulator [Propionibacteriaceae bacterium]
MSTPDEHQPEQGLGTLEGRRVVQLLWDPADPTPARGPKPRTNLTEVIRAGISIADAEGLAALSMRKVAAELGVGAMSLYTYVPGRDELIEVMIDLVYADHALPDPVDGWRTRVDTWARESWRIYGEHPWLLDFNSARLPIGPHVLDVEESLYAALAAGGFVGGQIVAQANLVRWQLLGAARSSIGDLAEERHTGVSTEAYWDSRASFWVTYFDYARFPTMAAIHHAGGFEDPSGWSFDQMLVRLLDGIEQVER